jgi:hypothetical protein
MNSGTPLSNSEFSHQELFRKFSDYGNYYRQMPEFLSLLAELYEKVERSKLEIESFSRLRMAILVWASLEWRATMQCADYMAFLSLLCFAKLTITTFFQDHIGSSDIAGEMKGPDPSRKSRFEIWWPFSFLFSFSLLLF